MECDIKLVDVKMPDGANVILGQTHFIKSAEDIYEALVCSAPCIKFGLAFCEASGDRLIRTEGNDESLIKTAAENAKRIACGHSFIIIMEEAYPVNVLNAIKAVPEVCGIFAATANPLKVIVAEKGSGRGIIGVIDGEVPLGLEDEGKRKERKDFLRKIGYKR